VLLSGVLSSTDATTGPILNVDHAARSAAPPAPGFERIKLKSPLGVPGVGDPQVLPDWDRRSRRPGCLAGGRHIAGARRRPTHRRRRRRAHRLSSPLPRPTCLPARSSLPARSAASSTSPLPLEPPDPPEPAGGAVSSPLHAVIAAANRKRPQRPSGYGLMLSPSREPRCG